MIRKSSFSRGCLAAFILVLAACGKTTGQSGRGGQGDGDRSNDADAGTAASSGETPRMDPGTGGSGVPDDGGSRPSGTGGSAGMGGLAGAGGLTGAGGLAGAGGVPSDDSGAAERLDPFAEPRRRTVTDYCGLLDTYECLRYLPQRGQPTPTGRDQTIAVCRRDLEVQQADVWGDACFDEWRNVIECYTNAAWECPCTYCELPTPGRTPPPLGGFCEAEEDALSACKQTADEGSTVTGASGECDFAWNAGDGCYVQCSRELGTFESDCTGPLGGAQTCSCMLNAVLLQDSVSDSRLWADDCYGIAHIMANGHCDRILDCCFTWVKDGSTRCSCTADPTAAGFASCEAAAAAGGGEIVALCPQHDIPWGEFPEP